MNLGLTGPDGDRLRRLAGMGLAIAEALAAEGANVAMLARRADVLGARGSADRRARRSIATSRPAGPRAPRRRDRRGVRRHRRPRAQRRRPAAGPATASRPGAVDEAVGAAPRCLVGLVRPLPAPPARERPRGRIVAIESTSVREPLPEPRPLERDPPGCRRLAQDARTELGAGGRSPSTRSPPGGSTPSACGTCTATTARRRRTRAIPTATRRACRDRAQSSASSRRAASYVTGA